MKRIIVAIPGASYTREFVTNLIQFIAEAPRAGLQVQLNLQYDAVVHFARAKCLGADVTRGIHQTPFGGSTEYDYILFIDSDIIFNTQQVLQLLMHMEANPSRKVVSGWYSMADAKNTTMVRKMDDEYYKKHGTYQFTSNEEMTKSTETLISCDYIGMGFMLLRRELFQHLQYPWFYEPLQELTPQIQDMCSEDVAFCKKIKRAGIEILVDPKCRVGHQKYIIL